MTGAMPMSTWGGAAFRSVHHVPAEWRNRKRFRSTFLLTAVLGGALAGGCLGPKNSPVPESPKGLPLEVVRAIQRACEGGYFDPLEKAFRERPALRRSLLNAVQGPTCNCPPNARRAIVLAVESGDWVPVMTFPPARTCLSELARGKSAE